MTSATHGASVSGTEEAVAAAVTDSNSPRYLLVPTGAARVNPYDEFYGESPYASEEGTRREVAFSDSGSHPNSQAAIAEIAAQGATINTFVLLLKCASKHKKKLRKQQAIVATNAERHAIA